MHRYIDAPMYLESWIESMFRYMDMLLNKTPSTFDKEYLECMMVHSAIRAFACASLTYDKKIG